MKSCRLFHAVLLVALLPILSGCGGGSDGPGPGNTAEASFTVHWPGRSRLIPVASESIKVSIANPQGQTVATNLMQRPAAGGDVTVIISPLPVGDLPVTAVAYPKADGTGTPQGTASVILHSVAGQVQPVTLSLNSTITSVEITAISLNVPTGGFQQLYQTPRDAAGNIVLTLPKTITWKSDKTSVATVDNAGKVTGVSTGTANITVTETESGKSKTVPVTVGTSSGAGGVIAFLGKAGGHLGIYVMAGDGSGITDINPDVYASNIWYSPTVSPNGQYVAIAYHAGAAIYDALYVVRTDGTGRPPTWAADLQGGFSWAPDSSRLVYSHGSGGGPPDGLHIVNPDGSGDVKITDAGWYPQWSPDGSRILASLPNVDQIFSILPNGTDLKNITAGYDAKWLPGSNRIVFRREVVGKGYTLNLINVDGTGETMVSDLNVGAYNVSPDGTKIAFSGAVLGGAFASGYMYTVGTGATTTLPTSYVPAWSPDSSWIAYGSATGLHFAHPDGSGDYVHPGISSATWVDWR